MTAKSYVNETKHWIQKVVIDLNLCPFAVQPFLENNVRYFVNKESDIPPIVNQVIEEARWLSSQEELNTSFVITPELDLPFENYYDLCCDLQQILESDETVNIVLVAFHPGFYYDNQSGADTTNATNRSPYPMIHLIPGDSFNKISGDHIQEVLNHNKELLEKMSWRQIRSLYS